MKTNKFLMVFAFALFVQANVFAQDKTLKLVEEDKNGPIVMTWNKNTPETEMKDDIKALAEKGITIKYSGVKRNSNQEITAIQVEYADRKGNKGELKLNNQNPVGTIKFYSIDGEIGFGEPQNNMGWASNDMFGAFPGDMMQRFNFGNMPQGESFSFDFPDGVQGKSKSKIMIQKDGRKPLVIEDGEVVEGADEYSPEEIEKIKNENKIEMRGFDGNEKQFDLRKNEDLEKFKSQFEKMQDNFKANDSYKDDLEKVKQEMIKAREEMQKARQDLEQTKKDLQKSKAKK